MPLGQLSNNGTGAGGKGSHLPILGILEAAQEAPAAQSQQAFLLSAASSRFLGLPPKETTSTHSLPQALFSDIINKPSEVGTSYTHFTDEESEAMSA